MEDCPWVLDIMQEMMTEGNVFEKMFIKAYQVKQVEVVCTTLWLLWSNRNRVVHDQVCLTVKELGRRVKENIESYHTATFNEGVSNKGVIIFSGFLLLWGLLNLMQMLLITKLQRWQVLES